MQRKQFFFSLNSCFFFSTERFLQNYFAKIHNRYFVIIAFPPPLQPILSKIQNKMHVICEMHLFKYATIANCTKIEWNSKLSYLTKKGRKGEEQKSVSPIVFQAVSNTRIQFTMTLLGLTFFSSLPSLHPWRICCAHITGLFLVHWRKQEVGALKAY